MKNTLLARTEMIRVEPVGKALRDHAILRVLIGEENAAMLATPVISSDGAAIDWYTPGIVRASRLVDLPAEQQSAPRAHIEQLKTELDALATQLEKRGGVDNKDSAAMLRDIPNLPDESYIFVVDGAPVLTAWSCARVDGGRFRAGLSVLADPPPPVIQAPPMQDDPVIPVAPATAVRERRRSMPWWLWLLWLLFALLVFAIMALLLRACALAPYVGWLGLGNLCTQEARANDDLGPLQLIVADLEDQLRRAAINCMPPAVAPVPEPEPVEEAPQDDAVAAANERTDGLQRGQLEIALIWETEDDLDLRVQFDCPQVGAGVISYRNKGQTICGGMLDQDANVTNLTTNPAEHIVWVDGDSIPPGAMDIIVEYYKDNGAPNPQVPYQIVIQREGEEPQIIEGILAPHESRIVTSLQN